jgi:regulator of replication initiation timing
MRTTELIRKLEQANAALLADNAALKDENSRLREALDDDRLGNDFLALEFENDRIIAALIDLFKVVTSLGWEMV